MSGNNSTAEISERFDSLGGIDREAVCAIQHQNFGLFASVYAGESITAAGFVSGVMFVVHGVSAFDLLTGLFIGNLLAVLSWTLICAPIATGVRFTSYQYVRKIAGPGVAGLYNLANAFLFCILAGAMISIAAAAVGIPFHMKMPHLTDTLPNGIGWILVVLTAGSAVGMIAVLDFKKICQFSTVFIPWIVLTFVAVTIAVLPQLGEIRGAGDFWRIASGKIWHGVPEPGREKLSLAHVIFFAWFFNAAMHIGLSDMALFRNAKHWTAGLCTAAGAYTGHFLVWICSGILVAAYGHSLEPGPIAYKAAGIAGAASVAIAGWIAANPAIYRASLALQAIAPNAPRWVLTIVSYLLATALACFPALVMNLHDIVFLYGLLLIPVGAIVFTEHWLLPRFGMQQYWAEKRNVFINIPALLTWIITVLLCWLPMEWLGIHLYFRGLPGWFLAVILYWAFCVLWDAQKPEELEAVQS